MTLNQIQQQIALMARPGGATSSIIAQNAQVWVNEFILRELYKLRRWWFLQQQQQIATTVGTSLYAVPGGEALYVVGATASGKDLLLPPLAQAQAFYAASGPPEAVALTVPAPIAQGAPASPLSIVSQVQVFPAPDTTYTIQLTVTSPFPVLAFGNDHNFVTDQFPMLVISGGLACAFLSLQEDQLFMQWWQIYRNQCRALAAYDHEVRRGGTMPESIDPYLPPFALGLAAAPEPAGAAAG
jgi:hypothetical protein